MRNNNRLHNIAHSVSEPAEWLRNIGNDTGIVTGFELGVDEICQRDQRPKNGDSLMIWSTHTAIRTRREQIGLSQSDLACQMGVTKSLLSHIEAGKRQPTEEQLAVLATVLQIPSDLLLLGSGRLPEDVRGAFTQNAAEAVAAVRERVEAHVVSYPQLPQCIPLPRGKAAALPKVKLPERIDVQKTSTSYRAHSYHTKVPPEAITPFIRAFTHPGDTILDPFCGSGMTGVAALMEGRNALLSDLSPAAVHIARNYTTPCDPRAFTAAVARVEKAVAPTIGWLYRPFGTGRHRSGSLSRERQHVDSGRTNRPALLSH